jgi:hypothetical protein
MRPLSSFLQQSFLPNTMELRHEYSIQNPKSRWNPLAQIIRNLEKWATEVACPVFEDCATPEENKSGSWTN